MGEASSCLTPVFSALRTVTMVLYSMADLKKILQIFWVRYIMARKNRYREKREWNCRGLLIYSL
jgi:hypothetical protein